MVLLVDGFCAAVALWSAGAVVLGVVLVAADELELGAVAFWSAGAAAVVLGAVALGVVVVLL